MLIPETEIIISRDGAELSRATVRPGDYVIGCHAQAEISIAAEGVAERHAQLTVNYHELFIEDLGSVSGTLIGGKPITESTRLWPSQKVQIGSVVLETRKVKSVADSSVSLAPHVATVRRVLPEEFFGERKYEIGGLIAQGGMGAILGAHEATTQRTVAMKVMLSHMSEGDVLRFIEEAQITSQLEHPNIVPVHELGVDEHDQVFYTMKLVQGVTLRQVLERLHARDDATAAAYPLRRLLIVLMRVCDAIAFAHSRGVIHRDLKPDNVMIGDFGEVLVMDWGLAKVLGAKRADAGPATDIEPTAPSTGTLSGSVRSVRDGAQFTMAGSIVGTPYYMSPEQARGQAGTLDEGSDIWSLGAILRHILTLEKPVPGEKVDEIVDNVRAGRLTRIPLRAKHCPGGRVPEALIAVTSKAQALKREDRYASVAQLREEIDAWLGGFATKAEQAGLAKQLLLLIQRHRNAFATAAAAWLLITALGVWFIFNLRDKESRAVAGEQSAIIQAGRASKAEKDALEKAEATRHALAKAQVAVGEAAFRSGDRIGMVQALDAVPADLRDQRWDYLSAKRDVSLGPLKALNMPNLKALAAVPGKPTQFAFAGANGDITIMDVSTGAKVLGVATGFTGAMALAFSPDGARFAVTAAKASEIHLLRTSDGQRLQALPAPSGNIERMVFSPDGNKLAVTDFQYPKGGKLSLVDLRDGAVRWQLEHPYAGVAFSPDGRRLFETVGLMAIRRFRVLDAETGQTISDRDSYTYCAAMSLDGKRLALGLHSGEVAIVDVATGAELRRARLHQGEVTGMAWTAGGHLLTVGNEGGAEQTAKGRRVLRLWETTSFALRGTFFGLARGDRMDWAFQPSSGYLVTQESPPQLWRIPVDLEAGRLVGVEQGWSTCFLSDTVALARKSYALTRYDVSNPRAPRELPPASQPSFVMSAVHWPSGQFAMARRINSGDFGFSIRIHGIADMAEQRKIELKTWVMRMDFDAPGERIVAITNGEGTRVFSTSTGETLLTLPQKMERAVFAGAGGNIAAIVTRSDANGDAQDELTIFDSKNGQLVKSVPSRLRLNELVVSPDRRLLAIAGEEQVIRVFDAETLDQKWSFRAHDGGITALAFHPSQPILASASNDGSVKLWDYEKARERQTFLGIDGTPVMLAFSPNGRLLALEAQESVWRIFDLAAEAPRAVAPGPAPVSNPIIESAPEADGWANLLAPLTPARLQEIGNGWSFKGGELVSPGKSLAILPLHSDLNGSYRVRVKLRRLSGKDVFHLVLPVGDRTTGFELDGFLGRYTGLNQVDGKFAYTLPGIVEGPQVTDLKPHDLEVTVRLEGLNATITSTLDARALYEWTGPIAALSQSRAWLLATERRSLALATVASEWAVSEVKVKRLEAAK